MGPGITLQTREEDCFNFQKDKTILQIYVSQDFFGFMKTLATRISNQTCLHGLEEFQGTPKIHSSKPSHTVSLYLQEWPHCFLEPHTSPVLMPWCL